MAYDKITFQKKLNDSVQVGDDLYYSNITNPNAPTDPTFVSKINWVGEKEIRINPNTAPSSILTTQIADVNIMESLNGNFDTDISNWTLDALTGVWGTTDGSCNGDSSLHPGDQAGCVSHGDCGTNINVTSSFCSTASVCSSYATIHLTSNACTDHGDCTGVSGNPLVAVNFNMLVDDCTDYGDCINSGPSHSYLDTVSVEETPCTDSGTCEDTTNTAVGGTGVYTTGGTTVWGSNPNYWNKQDCEDIVSCTQAVTGIDITGTHGTSGLCTAVGTCVYTIISGFTQTIYNVCDCMSNVAACTGNSLNIAVSWTPNIWGAYSWTSSSWNVYTWTNYTWDPLGLVWVGYNWINDGSVYHASENISLLNDPQRMYLDSMQEISKSGYVEQTVAVENGDEYTFIFDADVIVGDLNWEISGAFIGSGTYNNSSGPVTYNSGTFTAGTNYLKIRFFGTAVPDQVFAYIDNVSLLDDQYVQTGLDNFFMFQKPNDQNVSGLKGYYAEVTLTNDSTAKQELFAVGSEVTMSSK